MRYLNTEEVSQLLGCSRSTIQKRIASGRLVPINPYHSTGFLFEESKIRKAKEGLQHV